VWIDLTIPPRYAPHEPHRRCDLGQYYYLP